MYAPRRWQFNRAAGFPADFVADERRAGFSVRGGAAWGVAGAAVATLISQVLSGFLCLGYVLFRVPALTPSQHDLRPDRALFRRIFSVSAMTSIQQSIMNFGILCVQSLVNSFGLAAMAAFTAGVKIDSLAYSPAQDFGNGFTTFVAQNQGGESAAASPSRHPHSVPAFRRLLPDCLRARGDFR